MPDLRTQDCPVAAECGACGRRRDLQVCEVETDFGIACMTVCAGCIERGDLPPIGVFAAAACVNAHQTHLGRAGVVA